MGAPLSTGRSRMEAVKQMFMAFRDRTETLGGETHHLGLLQFDHEVEALLHPTSFLAEFEGTIDGLARGARPPSTVR